MVTENVLREYLLESTDSDLSEHEVNKVRFLFFILLELMKINKRIDEVDK